MSSQDPVRYAILGPLRISGESGVVDLDAPKQRLLLATLIVRANQPVPADVLFETLWPADRPAQPRKALAWHVIKLRQLLGGKESITWAADGYQLSAEADEIDAHRFRRLLREATGLLAEDPAAADRLLGEALALWRGPALGELAETGRLRDEAQHLDELRLSALELGGEAELALGRHAALVPALRDRVAQNPYRERFLSQLMLALYRCGRQAEALRAFTDGRARLADSLGLDPSPSLRELERRIVRGDPALDLDSPVRVPRQLPADIASFTGRERELAAITATKTDPGVGTIVLTAVDGLGGIGKTALAVHAAHRLAPDYPDGQLFIDLRGYSGDASAVSAAEALDRILRALGVEGHRIPSEPDERSALLRSVMAGRRMLMVLDNAAAEDQVRPLLPGGGHRVIVTSRHALTGLDEADQVPLGVLDAAEAVALFTRVAGLTGADTGLVTEVVELCGRLPLAVRIAASRLRGNPHWTLTELRRRLADDTRRVAELRVGDRRLEATFRLSLRELDERQRRAFRLLTSLPLADFGLAVAAVALDLHRDETDDLLADLVDSRLLDSPAADRYTFHDLVRLYGARLPGEDSTEVARDRMADWYIARAQAAKSRLTPWSPTLPHETVHDDVSFADYDSAAHWFDAELDNLMLVLRRSADRPEVVWLLADAMEGYFWVRHNTTQWLESVQLGLSAAVSRGDRAAEAAMRHGLGEVSRRMADYGEALAQQRLALSLAREVDDRHRVYGILLEVAATHQFSGDTKTAIEYARLAYTEVSAHGRGSPFSALDILGTCHQMRGELRKAAAVDRLCAYRKRESSSLSLQNTLGNLSVVYIDMGRIEDARQAATEALRIAEDHGAHSGVKSNLDNLARIDIATDDFDAAVANATEALRICDEIGARSSRPSLLATLALARLPGHPEESRRLAHEGVALARELRSAMSETETLVALAECCLALHDPAGAREHAQAARDIARDREYRVMEGRSTTILAEAALALKNIPLARELAREAADIQAATGCRPDRDRALRCLVSPAPPRSP